MFTIVKRVTPNENQSKVVEYAIVHIDYNYQLKRLLVYISWSVFLELQGIYA